MDGHILKCVWTGEWLQHKALLEIHLVKIRNDITQK